MLNEIITHPLVAIFITIGSYVAAGWLQKNIKGGEHLSPPVLSIACVVGYVMAFDIPYEDYMQDVTVIHSFLGPVTVALAIPLYHKLPIIRRVLAPIAIAVGVSALVAAGVGYGLSDMMGAAQDLKLSIIPKSTTMPVAIGIAERIGTDTSLAVFFVFTTGILGTLIATFLFQLVRIKDKAAIGFALGVTCHALGVAKATQYGEKATAFAVLGLSIMGIVSGVVLPILVLSLL